MTATIIVVGMAFYWLMRETRWLTIRLEAYETIEQYDARILGAMEAEEQEKQGRYQEHYQKWLDARYAEKTNYGGGETDHVDPRDKWLVVEEDLEKRRNGEMLYQRGNAAYIRYYNQTGQFRSELIPVAG
jgi:hypothetical protein